MEFLRVTTTSNKEYPYNVMLYNKDNRSVYTALPSHCSSKLSRNCFSLLKVFRDVYLFSLGAGLPLSFL